MFRALVFFLFVFHPTVWAVDFSSQSQATTVVELYTSEGCSSCPPAERWLSTLQHDDALFDSLLPMAFHVDYWDQLGWPDRFATVENSNRQRSLVREGLISQVYTPGIVINSEEWRGWFHGLRQPPTHTEQPGALQASLKGKQLAVKFEQPDTLVLNMAWLGNGLETTVKAGENKGKKLQHDFVVLQHWQQTGKKNWQVTVPPAPDKGQQQTALAIWLTKPGSLEIIQATATYID